MKKTLTVCLLILIGLYGIFTLLDYRGDYSAEKEFHKINLELARISKDPRAIPDATFDGIAKKYKNYIIRFEGSPLISVAEILRGRVFILKGDYAFAREEFEAIVERYADKPEVAVRAVAEIGNTYTKEEDWEKVLLNYQRILKEYPTTFLGIRTPLAISKFYANREDYRQSTEAIKFAIKHYKILISQYPDTRIEFDAMRLIANCYLALRNYHESVNILGDMLVRYAESDYLTPAIATYFIKTINTISVIHLKDYDVPIAVYQRFLDKYPEHRLHRYFKEIIKSLNEMKQNNQAASSSEVNQ